MRSAVLIFALRAAAFWAETTAAACHAFQGLSNVFYQG
jgi:hypothetical protein